MLFQYSEKYYDGVVDECTFVETVFTIEKYEVRV